MLPVYIYMYNMTAAKPQIVAIGLGIGSLVYQPRLAFNT